MSRVSLALLLLPLACGGDDVTASNTAADSTGEEVGDGDGDTAETGSADQDTGDGDGDTTGDGDGDTTGDGDGDTTGDGDGDGDTTGDGDGDTTGDGDGDGDTTGDGDGDGDTTGDGDGDGDGDTTGDGDGDTTTGDGDGDGDTTTGDGDGDGDGDTTTGDGDGDGDGDTNLACDEFDVVLQPTPPNVMLVLDKSHSMFTNYWDHDNDGNTPQITRWNSLYQVVDNIVTTFDAQIRFGANLFPSVQAQNVYGPQACLTSDFPEVTVGPGNGPAILATIPGPNVTNSYGGTPATIGIQTAYDHLMTLNPDNPAVMILVTDGAANCDQTAQTNFDLFEVYDDALPLLVGDALADGISTYVVGIDIANMVTDASIDGEPNGINPTVKLNEVAQEGGTGNFLNSQDQAELETALNSVIDSALSCKIPLEEEPFFPDFTKVFVNGMEWSMVNDCASEDGWVYSIPYSEIEMCGAACDALKDAGEASIEYHCTPG